MLKQVRTALKGVVAWFIIALLVLAFALWGVPELRNFTQRPPLQVGEVSFTAQDVVTEFNRIMEQRRREMNGAYSREQALAENLPKQVVDAMAARSLLEQEAGKLGLSMPRELVREVLQSDERFQNAATGKFDQFALQDILARNGLTVRQFESLLSADLLRNQLLDAIGSSIPAPAAMTEAIVLRDSERRRVSYLTITDEMAGTPATPTAEDLMAYYEANTAQFMAPEYRTFAAVILKQEDYATEVAVSEEALRAAYEAARSSRYDQPEKRTIYQITYETEAAAEAAAASLRQGKPVENLASERGMSLAQVTFTDVGRKDLLDPSVSEAAFAEDLVPGAIAGPVKSLFGWTVVQLAAVTPAAARSFEEVREEIAAELGMQDNRKKLLETIDAIEEARDIGAGLAAAAETAGVPVVRFGPVDSYSFAPGGEIVAGVPGEVLAAAFKTDEGEESEVVELADDQGYFFVQVEDVTPAAALPFDKVANEVEQRWRNDERKSRVEATAKAVHDAVAGGATLESEAARLGRAELETILARNSRFDAFSDEMKDRIFKAAPDAILVGEANSAFARTVAVVREVGFARAEAMGQAEAYRPFLGYQLTQEHLDAYLAALRSDYKVRADDAAITQIFTDAQ